MSTNKRASFFGKANSNNVCSFCPLNHDHSESNILHSPVVLPAPSRVLFLQRPRKIPSLSMVQLHQRPLRTSARGYDFQGSHSIHQLMRASKDKEGVACCSKHQHSGGETKSTSFASTLTLLFLVRHCRSYKKQGSS